MIDYLCFCVFRSVLYCQIYVLMYYSPQDNRTALIIAVEQGREDIVKILLDKRASPEQADSVNTTSFIYLFITVFLYLFFSTLIISQSNYWAQCTFCEHASHAKLTLLQALRTPLIIAVERGRVDIVKLLLGRRASPECKDQVSSWPLTVVLSTHSPHLNHANAYFSL